MLAVWRDRRGYFGGELKKSEYFKTNEKHLIYDLPKMVEALQHDDGGRFFAGSAAWAEYFRMESVKKQSGMS